MDTMDLLQHRSGSLPFGLRDCLPDGCHYHPAQPTKVLGQVPFWNRRYAFLSHGLGRTRYKGGTLWHPAISPRRRRTTDQVSRRLRRQSGFRPRNLTYLPGVIPFRLQTVEKGPVGRCPIDPIPHI